tara:strand:- start:160 stop:411 length:252 start_codon:yes stop_codon:yes gene_type:complete
MDKIFSEDLLEELQQESLKLNKSIQGIYEKDFDKFYELLVSLYLVLYLDMNERKFEEHNLEDIIGAHKLASDSIEMARKSRKH